jgi:hypothetical protein
VLKTYLEVTCDGAANGPDGTPILSYRWNFAIPANLTVGGYYRLLIFKRCAGSSGSFRPVGRTDVFIRFVQPFAPSDYPLAVFPQNPVAGQPITVVIENRFYQELALFQIVGNRVQFYVSGGPEDDDLFDVERPIRRTITLPAGNYILSESTLEAGDPYRLPFQVSAPLVTRSLPASSISSQLFLGLMLVVAGGLSLRKMIAV